MYRLSNIDSKKQGRLALELNRISAQLSEQTEVFSTISRKIENTWKVEQSRVGRTSCWTLVSPE